MKKRKSIVFSIVLIIVALYCVLGVQNYVYADYVRPEDESVDIVLKKAGDPSFRVVLDNEALVEKLGDYDEEHYKVKVFDCEEVFYLKKEKTNLIPNMDSKKQVVLQKETQLKINIDDKISIQPDDKYTMYRIGYQQGDEDSVCVWVVHQKGSYVGFINKGDIKEGEKIVIVKAQPKKTLGLKILVMLLIAIPASLFVVFCFVPSKKYYVRQTPILIDGTAEVDKAKKDN